MRVSKLTLARWRSHPIKYRVRERRPIIGRLPSTSLKSRLRWRKFLAENFRKFQTCRVSSDWQSLAHDLFFDPHPPIVLYIELKIRQMKYFSNYLEEVILVLIGT